MYSYDEFEMWARQYVQILHEAKGGCPGPIPPGHSLEYVADQLRDHLKAFVSNKVIDGRKEDVFDHCWWFLTTQAWPFQQTRSFSFINFVGKKIVDYLRANPRKYRMIDDAWEAQF
jgi:hypothetical protein